MRPSPGTTPASPSTGPCPMSAFPTRTRARRSWKTSPKTASRSTRHEVAVLKLLLVGANGQVGHALRRSLAPLGEVVVTTRDGRLDDGVACETLDLADLDAIAPLVARVRPDVVVNAAAYTAVDRAEDEAELAFRVNAQATGRLAATCAAADVPLVHYSTDYV